jgi:hypothetical protein
MYGSVQQHSTYDQITGRNDLTPWQAADRSTAFCHLTYIMYV